MSPRVPERAVAAHVERVGFDAARGERLRQRMVTAPLEPDEPWMTIATAPGRAAARRVVAEAEPGAVAGLEALQRQAGGQSIALRGLRDRVQLRRPLQRRRDQRRPAPARRSRPRTGPISAGQNASHNRSPSAWTSLEGSSNRELCITEYPHMQVAGLAMRGENP